ncbi:MAG: helix-turn-helix domain-containing protein [Candidatus Paracaedibacter sp.]|jgi:transcriptional regulator with XRE-family HTH domain
MIIKKKSLRLLFAKNIRKARIEKELSQEAFADLCGLHRTYIGSVERGERNVSIDNIERIALSLSVSPAFLLQDAVSDE